MILNFLDEKLKSKAIYKILHKILSGSNHLLLTNRESF